MPNRKKEAQESDFTILIDRREQLAYTFSNIKPCPQIEYATLQEGDYSIKGYKDKIGIERKEKSDLFGSMGTGRARFQRECERLSKFQYAAIVTECSLADIFKNPPSYSKMSSKAVFRTLLVWSIRYNIKIWNCPDRSFAERLTYLLLEKFYIEATQKI